MFFLLISCSFNIVFINPVEIENTRLKLALIIPTGAPITIANGAIEALPVVIDKTIT